MTQAEETGASAPAGAVELVPGGGSALEPGAPGTGAEPQGEASGLASTPARSGPRAWRIDTTDPFNDVHCPISDGLSLWLMRQNLITDGLQTILKYEHTVIDEGKTPVPRVQITGYVPLLKIGKLSAMVGTSYDKVGFLHDDREVRDNANQYLFVWPLIEYMPDETWKIMVVSDYYQRLTGGNEFSGKGNNLLSYVLVAKHFEGFQVIGLAARNHQTYDKGSKTELIGGLQVKWLPTDELKLMVGVPVVFAGEWAPSRRINTAAYVFYSGEMTAFVRYRATEDLGVSVVFSADSNDTESAFFDRRALPFVSGEGEPVVYNQVVQTQRKIGLELGIRTSSHTAIQVSGGYNFGGDVVANLNDKVVRTLSGARGPFVGVSVYLVDYLFLTR